MEVNYSLIAELPDLKFDPEATFELPEHFLGSLEGKVFPGEMDCIRLLWFQKFNRKLAAFFSGRLPNNDLLPGLDATAFHTDNEGFHQAPAYLQNLVRWKERQKEYPNETLISQKLQEFHYGQMRCSKNRFLKCWGELELNRLNLLAAGRCEINSLDKEEQLIKGNGYSELLHDFSVREKIIRTEFSVAPQLEIIIKKINYQERELAMDQVRWDMIDEINRFEYFTVDVLLGYFQKLLLLERWATLLQRKKPVNPVELANKMIKEVHN